ncbi:MAG: SPOR domain-containing protein [Alphaproteobacteria bacterium]
MNRYIFRLLFVPFSFFLVSCGSTSDQIEGVKTEKVGVEKLEAREEIKTKLDVYDSMARATKFNVDDLKEYLATKVFDPRLEYAQADQVVASFVKGGEADRLPIYDSLRGLDFSVTFAAANAEVMQKQKNADVLFHKSAQSLALNAIKYHERVIYINKKTKEIGKTVDQLQKKIASLNEKFDNDGKLSPEETEHKKNLEVIAYKFIDLNKTFLAEKEEYAKLIKAAPQDKLKLEGKQFYEVSNLDKSLTIDVFQKGAINSRAEFFDIYANEKKYSFADVETIVVEKYPDAQTLMINGYGVGDERYLKALEKRANSISHDLVKDTLDYRFNSSKRGAKEVYASFSDNLAIAIFTQIELAYNVVVTTDVSVSDMEKEMKLAKDNLHKLEKGKQNNEIELRVYNEKRDIIEMGYKLSKMKSERAAAIRALYFYSGLDIFSKELLEKPVKDVAKDLKVAFNTDVVSTLSKVKKNRDNKDEVVLGTNEWAKKEGWLETLVAGEKETTGELPPPPPTSNVPMLDLSKFSNAPSIDKPVATEYYDESHNDRTMIQLGAYTDVENANAHWAKVFEKYPEIRKFSPQIEEVSSGGSVLNRLVVKSPQGGLVNICNAMKSDGMDCILR